MIYRLCTDLPPIDDALLLLLEQMPAERREAVLGMKHEQGRREKLVAYNMLCEMLHEEGFGEVLPSFVAGEHGKPRLLEYPQVEFNLSHCRKAVAVALHDAPVGIDVECRRKVSDRLMQRVCSAEEIEWIMGCGDPYLAFSRLWTRKEAYVKMTGRGIQDDLHTLGLPLTDGLCSLHGMQFTLESHLLPLYSGWVSVCYITH